MQTNTHSRYQQKMIKHSVVHLSMRQYCNLPVAVVIWVVREQILLGKQMCTIHANKAPNKTTKRSKMWCNPPVNVEVWVVRGEVLLEVSNVMCA